MRRQAEIRKDGSLAYTPNAVIYEYRDTTIRVGKFWRPGNDDFYGGLKYQKGNINPTVLYPTDTSRIKRETTYDIKF